MRRSRAAVLTAAPGAGKTTRIPPALIDEGAVILLQPRRVAARAIAARIAAERNWALGAEVGWQVRFDRRFSASTRLLVVTEGILTARLQTDPLLSDFRTIVLDEFHERSIHADLAIALARQAWLARDDLRIVVMSATLDAEPVAAYLNGCPIIDVPGRRYPIDTTYAPDQTVAEAVAEVAPATPGSILCFLPGAADIRRVINDLAARTNLTNLANVEVFPLHGSLSSDDQDRALTSSGSRRIIVATNIAETSLTVPAVTAVVDSGLEKVARYDAARGIDTLETERITADAADQRAGRAGRLAPGIVRRLWDSRDRLRRHREPEIRRIDLSSPILDVLAWGGDPRTLEWFEAPRADAVERALELLERLQLVADGKLTDLGNRVRRVPLHPRLGTMLVASGGARNVARACALLSERNAIPTASASTTSDLLSAIDRWHEMPFHVQRTAEQIAVANTVDLSDDRFRRVMLAGFPDRVAQRREPGSDRFLVASGTGATLARESGVREGELIAALDVRDQIIRIASRVERDWLTSSSTETVHRFDAATGRVRASKIERYGAIVLNESPVAVDREAAAPLLAAAWLERVPRGEDERLLRRLRFAGHEVDLAAVVSAAAASADSFEAIRIADGLPSEIVRSLGRDAPDSIRVPSGRSLALDYADDGSVSLEVKLQELFGLAETPRIGRKREALTLTLLAPNGRPVQVTRDLRSFWERTYPEVRKELRARYPKHPWPEDPWTATPTHRTVRRK